MPRTITLDGEELKQELEDYLLKTGAFTEAMETGSFEGQVVLRVVLKAEITVE